MMMLKRLSSKAPTVTLALAGATWLVGGVDAAPQAGEAIELRDAASFSTIADEQERSRALFSEATKVLTHARCINCHPAGETALQGEDRAEHEPPISRGSVNLGVIGMRCSTCHLDANFDPGAVPGAPHWSLAPVEMAWEGLSHRELCEQIKDPKRNGNRDLAAIVKHMSEDPLVAWAWSPGAGRTPPPGSQQVFGEIIAAWANAGAACPE